MHGDFTRMLWKKLPGWVEDGSIKPLGFKVVEGGLSLDGVNRAFDSIGMGGIRGSGMFILISSYEETISFVNQE
jgi:hypothetical protein